MQGKVKLNMQQQPLHCMDPVLPTLTLNLSPKRGYDDNVVQPATREHAHVVIANQTSSATVSPRRYNRRFGAVQAIHVGIYDASELYKLLHRTSGWL